MKKEIYQAHNLRIINQECANQNRDDFIFQYDQFIDETNTEDIEFFFRRMAERFYQAGFRAGVKQSLRQASSL